MDWECQRRKDEAREALGDAWSRYLGLDEQKALASFTDASAPLALTSLAGGSESVPDTEQMRQAFEDFATGVAPAVGDVVRERHACGGVNGTWFRPRDARPDRVLLYLHGGAYVLGSPDTAAGMTMVLAQHLGIPAFSVDYPLAPEHPHPAALESAVSAYLMLLEQGFTPHNMVVAGDSAGGGLALAMLVVLRERAIPMPAGVLLMSPWTDLTLSLESHRLKQWEDRLIDRASLDAAASAYAGSTSRSEPRVSPVFADMQGLPPLLIHVGSGEALLDDSLTLSRHAALAHVPVELRVWPGYGHVHQMMWGQLESARCALEEAAEFLGKALNGRLFKATAPLAMEGGTHDQVI